MKRWSLVQIEKHRVEVPVIPWPDAPGRLLRISSQCYNHSGQFELLAGVLKPLLND